MHKNDISIFFVIETIFFFLILSIYYVTYYYLYQDAFLLDVANTFINNLFGTGRFSVFPFADVSIFYFWVLNSLFFCVINRIYKDKLKLHPFLLVSIIDVVYILFIGGMYILKWAERNFQRSGEYLTGFEKYMVPAVGLIYLYWGYELVVCLRHKKF